MKATPYQTAAALYPTDEAFRRDFEAHLAAGWVYSTPTCFVLARTVLSTAPPEHIANPWHQFERCDAWFVWLAAGSLVEIFDAMPFPLPLAGFARFDGLPAKFRPLERIKALAKLGGDSPLSRRCTTSTLLSTQEGRTTLPTSSALTDA